MTLRREITDFLMTVPGMDSADGRKALIGYLGFAHLNSLLDFHGNAFEFTSRLVALLESRGKAELRAFLVALESAPHVSAERRETVAGFVRRLDGTDPQPTPQALAYDVFLSYNRQDTPIMRRLLNDLQGAGFTVWTDGGLTPGTQVWQDAIEEAVERSRCMVVVMTPRAKRSKWVRNEVDLAQELERMIFPVLAEGERRDAVLFSLRDVQHVDARTDYAGEVEGKLIPTLRKHLGVAEVAAKDVAPLKSREDAAQSPMAFDMAKLVEEQPSTAKPKKDVAPKSEEDAKLKFTEADVAEPIQKRPSMAKPKEDVTSIRSESTPQIVIPKPTILRPALDIEWITIPAGEFLMGSDKHKDKRASDKETPQHPVHLPEYRIAKYPITNVQYLEFVRAVNYQSPNHWKDDQIPDGKEQHPVVNVSWQDAQAFCEWANVRLPTEAEWEKAARGVEGRIWPWGNEFENGKCNSSQSGIGDTTPVRRYPKGESPYGLMDMAGNVWEWTVSLYNAYPYEADDGREDPKAVGSRTLRGGSWFNDEYSVRCASRYGNSPSYSLGRVGFRVVSRRS